MLNQARKALQARDFSGLPPDVYPKLLWHAELIVLSQNDLLYQQNAASDDSFCLLVDGSIEIPGTVRALDVGVVIGEKAVVEVLRGKHSASSATRLADVKVTSSEAVFLKWDKAVALMKTTGFESVRRKLESRWEETVLDDANKI